MWSLIVFALLLNQVLAGIFIPIHGYGKTTEKRSLGTLVAAFCNKLFEDSTYSSLPEIYERHVTRRDFAPPCQRYVGSI